MEQFDFVFFLIGIPCGAVIGFVQELSYRILSRPLQSTLRFLVYFFSMTTIVWLIVDYSFGVSIAIGLIAGIFLTDWLVEKTSWR